MKKIAIFIGLNIVLWGCSSVDETGQNEVITSTRSIEQMTKDELDLIGYKCEMINGSFSRIKKESCTTAAQREVREERSKIFLKNQTRTVLKRY